MTFLEIADICHSAFDGGASVEQAKALEAAKLRAPYTVSEIYDLADALLKADREIAGFWRHLTPDREAALQAILGDYDFLMISKAVRAYADAWQDEIDGEPS